MVTSDLVLVAGATGFIGRALGPALSRRFVPVGLSRADRSASGGYSRFVRCDLLSLEDTARAVAGARYCVYLVHSMLPTARLTQASFADLDLLCADNFGRAAAKAGVEHIVYLGGLIPRVDLADPRRAALSAHLASRLEVEEVLAGHGVPVTVVRAGLVLGAEGSSYQIVSRLVRRLPVMLCPAWTTTRTQPVALADVVSLLVFALGDERVKGRVFDVGTPEVTTYLDLMKLQARLLSVRRTFLRSPLFTPGLSRLWLSLVTGAPRALAGPLVESLRHEMTARDADLTALAGLTPTSLEPALERALRDEHSLPKDPFGRAGTRRQRPARSTVTSLQRMRLPQGRDATWAARHYPSWLGSLLRRFLRVDVEEGGRLRFRSRLGGLALLVLEHVPGSSATDRVLYRVTGGLLARPGQSGTLEFREVKGDGTVLILVRDFEPRLPWWIYRWTQAVAHGFIMRKFGRALKRGTTIQASRSRDDL